MKEFSLPVLVKLLLEWSNTSEPYPYHSARSKIENLPASKELYERFYNGDLQYPSYGLEVFGIDSYLTPDGAAFSLKANPVDKGATEFKAKLLPSRDNPSKYTWVTVAVI